VLAGLLFIAWLLPFAGHEAEFLGPHGWFDLTAYREASHLLDGPPIPLGWSALYVCGNDVVLLRAFYWLSLAVLALFTLGLWTRVTGVLTWVIVVSFAACPAMSYDGDALLGILAFYLMAGYLLLGQWDGGLSLRERLLGPDGTWLFARRPEGGRPPSYAANLAVRLIQVHFAIVFVVAGLHKLQFGDWWYGVALWYALHPAPQTTPEALRAYQGWQMFYLQMLSLTGYLVLAWQIGFPLFAWRRRWRPVLLGGALVGWLGTSLVYRLPLFGPVVVIACLSYLTPAEWLAVTGWARRLAGLARLPGAARGAPAPERAAVAVGTKA
jgi:hypothetical protein